MRKLLFGALMALMMPAQADLLGSLREANIHVWEYGNTGAPAYARAYCVGNNLATFVVGKRKDAHIVMCKPKANSLILKHEAVHAAQWCHSGRPTSGEEMEPLGVEMRDEIRWASSQFVALHYSSEYPAVMIPLEIEAQGLAMSLDENAVAAIVTSYCAN